MCSSQLHAPLLFDNLTQHTVMVWPQTYCRSQVVVGPRYGTEWLTRWTMTRLNGCGERDTVGKRICNKDMLAVKSFVVCQYWIIFLQFKLADDEESLPPKFHCSVSELLLLLSILCSQFIFLQQRHCVCAKQWVYNTMGLQTTIHTFTISCFKIHIMMAVLVSHLVAYVSYTTA